MTAECNAVTFQSEEEFWHQAFENFLSNVQNRDGVKPTINGLAVKLREYNIITTDDLQLIKNKKTDSERFLLVIDQMSRKDGFCNGFFNALIDCKLSKYAVKFYEEAEKLIENGRYSAVKVDFIRSEIQRARSAYSDNQMIAHGSADPSGKIRFVPFLL